ncbi:unnamed protein product [Camellia sinensis]
MGNILFTKGSASGGDRSSKRDIVGAQIDPNILFAHQQSFRSVNSNGEDAEYSTLAEVELKKMFAGKVSSPPSCRFRSPLQLLRSQTLCPQRSLSSSPSSPLPLHFHHRVVSTVASPPISTDSNYGT